MVADGHRYNTSGGVGDRANEENLESCLEAIPGRPSAHEVHTAAVKGTVATLNITLGWNAGAAEGVTTNTRLGAHCTHQTTKQESAENGERMFPCLQCGKRFTHKGNLNTHILTHTGACTNSVHPECRKTEGSRNRRICSEPPWREKLQQRITHQREEIWQITSFLQDQNHTRNLLKKTDRMTARRSAGSGRPAGRETGREGPSPGRSLGTTDEDKDRKIKARKMKRQLAEKPGVVCRHVAKTSTEVQDPPEEEAAEGCCRPLLLEDPTQHQAAPGIQTTTVKHTSKQQQCQPFSLHRKVCWPQDYCHKPAGNTTSDLWVWCGVVW